MINLKNFTKKELREWFSEMGEKPFRADQVFDWFNKGVTDFDEMTNLSVALREKLKAEIQESSLILSQVQESKKYGTKKYLFVTKDGHSIETVLMRYRYGNSVCVSSQAGCRMGCTFCASGLKGLKRDLDTSEIMDQVLLVQNDIGEKVGNVVIMGTGEPLANYKNVKKFIENLSVSRRNITLSTCGLIPEMARLGDELPQINLAVSLHAPNDELRSQLVPINKKYPIKELIQAVKNHIEKTGRRVTFEYALIKGVNDSDENIEELIRLVLGMNIHINLIPLNNVPELCVRGTEKDICQRHLSALDEAHIQATLRRKLGRDIDAACGQLRLK